MNKISIDLPKSWEELNERQFISVCEILADEDTDGAKLVAIFLGLAGIEVVDHDAATLTITRNDVQFRVDRKHLADCVLAVDWALTPPNKPIRPRRLSGKGDAVAPDLHGLTFESLLAAENIFQGYLLTNDDSLLTSLARLLYRCDDVTPTPGERLAVAWWFANAKVVLSDYFSDFYRPNPIATPATPNKKELLAIAAAQIRALTKGDITKEEAVKKSDCWAALYELDALARQAREFDEQTKRK